MKAAANHSISNRASPRNEGEQNGADNVRCFNQRVKGLKQNAGVKLLFNWDTEKH